MSSACLTAQVDDSRPHGAIRASGVTRCRRPPLSAIACLCVDTWAAEDGVWTCDRGSEPIAPWPTPEQVVQVIDKIAAGEVAVEQARQDLHKTGINPDVL